MDTPITVPKMDLTTQDVEFVAWSKSEGSWAEEGEVVAEIGADKANVEIKAPAAGSLVNLRVRKGDTVPVGGVLGYIRGR